jgi:hypothetical protein
MCCGILKGFGGLGAIVALILVVVALLKQLILLVGFLHGIRRVNEHSHPDLSEEIRWQHRRELEARRKLESRSCRK